MVGLPIVGEVGRSGRWKPISKKAKITVEELDQWAWEIQKKILWQDTLKEVKAGYTIGPFYNKDEVTKEAGTDKWIPASIRKTS